MSEFEEAVRRASALPMTSATPKPRAGEYTKGPWRIVPGMLTIETLYTDGGYAQWIDIAICHGRYEEGQAEANAQRIVACVNACEGIPDEALPDALRNAREQDSAIRAKVETNLIAAERDDLAKALEVCDKAIRGVIGDGPVRGNGTPYPVWADMISAAVQARAALAKVRP